VNRHRESTCGGEKRRIKNEEEKGYYPPRAIFRQRGKGRKERIASTHHDDFSEASGGYSGKKGKSDEKKRSSPPISIVCPRKKGKRRPEGINGKEKTTDLLEGKGE